MGDEGEGDSVQVAVRMRVFNGREKNVNATRIVRMANLEKGSKTWVTDPDTGEEREFKYDYSFQSHNETEKGIGDYATQDIVMQALGLPVLNAALEGRNVSLFAYGQTGAGKSFSMLGKVGVPELEGIIPRTCKEIFRRIDAEENALVMQNVDIQVVEIYCEMVNDLLADRKNWPQNGHKPRLTPKDGYVVDTTKKPCLTVDSIWSAMEFADKNRSVGSHALNPESSRAHTIYQINYAKVTKNEAGKVVQTLTAKLNLIDLAGSERTDSAGTTGQMLKEGNAINLSLTALGGCIKALSEGKRPNFRDSKLTLLLQASMTSGKVIMIAALSPASICYPETLSTLKFADRIKQVKIKSAKNVSEDPVAEIKKAMEEMRNNMQSEIERLKAIAGGDVDAQLAAQAGGGGKIGDLKAALEEQDEAEKRMREELEQQIALLEGTDNREEQAAEIEAGWDEAFAGVTSSKDEKRPHFVNLNPDERLAETLSYAFDEGETTVGRADKENPPTLEFSGMGMLKDHCKITVEGDKVWIENGSGRHEPRSMVNGKRLKGGQKVQVIHQTRVWLGNNYAFRFIHPGHEDKGEGLEEDPDYFFAEQEIAAAEGGGGSGDSGDDSGLSALLRHKLAEAEKKVEQGNIIATDLEKDVVFSPKIFENRQTKETDVVVHVQIGSQSLTWPWEKFAVRLTDMVQMWTEWQSAEAKGEEMRARDPTEDPFVDVESQLIGEADIWLNALANMVEFGAETAILSIFGQVQGKVSLELNPCDVNGNTGPWDDEDEDLDPFVDEPSELLGEDIQFEVKIGKVEWEPGFAKVENVPKYDKLFIRYKFNATDDEEEWTKTKEDCSGAEDFSFAFSKVHKVHVDEDKLAHIQKGKVTFQLWGNLNAQAMNTKSEGGEGISSRLEAKKAELTKLEVTVTEMTQRLVQKKNLIEEKNKELVDLDKQIAQLKAEKGE